GGQRGPRNPTYNLDGGQLDITTGVGWGFGSNARFNQNRGTVNHGGTSLSIGRAGGAKGYITMTSGTFNANSVTQLNLGNGGNGQAHVDLSGDAVFNATIATLVVGQFGTGALGTLTISEDAALNTSSVVLGGNNNGSTVTG